MKGNYLTKDEIHKKLSDLTHRLLLISFSRYWVQFN